MAEARPESTTVVTIFRSRLRPEAEELYRATAPEIEALARAAPGFVDFKSFVAPDGERCSIVVFADEESHAAWRDDPRHREVQALGRERFYESYEIVVCRPIATRRFGPSA